MGKDDFEVIAFKVLSYAYACIKAGVVPSWAKAEEVAGCNPVYFAAIIGSLSDSGYIRTVKVFSDMNGEPLDFSDELTITIQGTDYLRENSRMQKVAKFLGKAFEKALEIAVSATMAL